MVMYGRGDIFQSGLFKESGEADRKALGDY